MEKKILAILVVVILVAGGSGVALYAASSNNTTASVDFTSAQLANMTWGDIVEKARGQTVNWYFWGGDPNVNSYVDNQVTAEAAKYGIKINRIPVNDASEFVNKVAGDKQAGKDSGGSVDLVWINGENFWTMKQGNLLFGPWADKLPNSVLVDWNSASIAYDMGYPVNYYESPWGTAQFQMIYDSAKTSLASLPKNYTELKTWVIAHPGKFTYAAPPAFFGTTFVKAALYELTGGFAQYQNSSLTLASFRTMAEPLFQYLESIEPYLWNQGQTYPSDIAAINQMFNNGEVDLSMTFGGAGIAPMITSGQLPSTAKVYCMNTSIANTNYVAIPYNANAKAGAMVVANILLEPAQQAKWIQLTGNAASINVSMLSGWRAAAINDVMNALPAGTYVSPAEMARTKAPDLGGNLITYIEQVWGERIGGT
ncbi:MAG TPA: ABC transporter substrate-binding protein [Methanomassiliicoccales archaeon]|nr:ABC transporter substrate-binding protein [Methanomassiliicoccales archaeon]